MELVARENHNITIKFRAEEFVKIVSVLSAARQGYQALDRELLDHMTNKEVADLSDDLIRIFERKSQNA